ncbi:MAG: HEAT repeat domain-containing protein [Anaerolineae bacterium]|nr:HEAT repeat domain-containing protein [Anaerolineae bacterium]
MSGRSAVWIERLRYPDRRVRLEAIRQLEVVGEPAALGALARVFATDPDPDVRTMARSVGKAIYYAALKRAAETTGPSDAERQRAADILAKAQARKRQQRRKW